MRTMARFVLFSMLVACSLRDVFTINCQSVGLETVMNCNDCIRCGGYWCNKPQENEPHCASQRTDNWCSNDDSLEKLPKIEEESVAGDTITPSRYAVTVNVDHVSPRVPFQYNWDSSVRPSVEVSVINTTQTARVGIVEKETKCKNGQCITHISVKPETDFCLSRGGKYEYVNMKVRIDNLTEESVVKYHVPCACACSDNVEKNSPTCNKRGDFSCGVCSCHRGWSGEHCETKEKPKCEDRRGDIQCTNPYKQDVECSGNGYCGPCDTCICYDDREGSQYFQTDNFCTDLCMSIANQCESCLYDRPLGKCPDCNLTVRNYNESLLSDRDDLNRHVWVKCKEVINDCTVEYAAMKDEYNHMSIMKINSCNSIAEAIGGANVNIMLPTVLGVIALVAAVATVAGYMVWKSKNAPMPLSASQYQELDGPEGSAGMNPLYKSPTSSYNNPMWKGAKV
ncbi:hypothetical protein ACJJTC_012247 [Scirpophaga incertulas]